jgi:thiol-disulfide isomerase/thioredoxin
MGVVEAKGRCNVFFDIQVLQIEISTLIQKGELEMRKNFTFTIGFAFVFLLPSYTPIDEKLKIDEILNRIEDKIQRIENLSYETTYIHNTQFQADSIFQSSGKVWLQILPDDTMFGCRFHVEGRDKHGEYDYYYDGSKSLEIRHSKKEITIFNPYEFPDTPNNPAKARTALNPFVDLLIDKNIVNTLQESNPKKSLKEDNKSECWLISFEYPQSESGQSLTQKLFIDKSTLTIKRIEKRVLWRGMTSLVNIAIENYEMNNKENLMRVFLTKTYEDYAKEVYTRDRAAEVSPVSDLDGKEAPDFEYTSFDGEKVRLSRMRGKIILLDFWESWCGYCLLALPKLNELLQEYKNKGLIIVGITTENREQIEKLIKFNHLNYINIFADKTILKDYKVTARPTYYLINKNGIIIKTSYGDLEKIEAAIKAITD